MTFCTTCSAPVRRVSIPPTVVRCSRRSSLRWCTSVSCPLGARRSRTPDEHVTTKADVKRNRNAYFSAKRAERAYRQLPLHKRLRSNLPNRFGGIDHPLDDVPASEDIDGPRDVSNLPKAVRKPAAGNYAPVRGLHWGLSSPLKTPLTGLLTLLPPPTHYGRASARRPARTRISSTRSRHPTPTLPTKPTTICLKHWNKRKRTSASKPLIKTPL